MNFQFFLDLSFVCTVRGEVGFVFVFVNVVSKCGCLGIRRCLRGLIICDLYE